MAKADHNAITRHLQGRLGDIVFRHARGKLEAAWRPRGIDRAPPTANMLAHQARFKEALSYADESRADPEKWAVYERVGAQRAITARAVAVGDWFHAPKVNRIDTSGYRGQAGDTITLSAEDDVAVRAVSVKVMTAEGAVLEEGACVRVFNRWVYTATTAIPAGTLLSIAARAVDWVGNEGKGNKTYP